VACSRVSVVGLRLSAFVAVFCAALFLKRFLRGWGRCFFGGCVARGVRSGVVKVVDCWVGNFVECLVCGGGRLRVCFAAWCCFGVCWGRFSCGLWVCQCCVVGV